MTLPTHAIVGAAAASLFPQAPVAAFIAGFVSHLVIDAIPHWNEGRMLRSLRVDPNDHLNADMELGKDFLLDLAYLGSETAFGLAVGIGIFCFWLFHVSLLVIFLGVIGGLLPDALHFVYFKTHSRILKPFESFHSRIQKEFPNPILLGTEVLLVFVIVGTLTVLR